MSRAIKDLTGQVFGELSVLYKSGANRQGSIVWLCKCSCGNEKTISSDHLTRKNNSVKSCGCKKIKQGPEHHQWNGYEEISGNWWYNHILRERKQTKRTKLNITLTIQEAWDLFLIQERKCALSGIEISIINNTASIDRIDSSKGYELENVQWVHKDINKMKNCFSQRYFIDMCKKVSKEMCEITF